MLANELKRNDLHLDKLELDEAEINELLIEEFLEVDDYPGLDETLAAFEHTPEYLALINRGSSPDHVRPLLELAAEHWLDPDDIDGPHLLELIHDLPLLRPCRKSHIKSILDGLHAFWAFATRELHYPHGRACMATLRGEAIRALECAIDNASHDARDNTRHSRSESDQLRAGSSLVTARAGACASSNPRRSASVIS